MSQFFKYHKLLCLISFLFGLLYFFFIHTSILKINNSNFIIESKIKQEKSFHIRRQNTKSTLQCNGQNLTFDNPKKKDYWYHGTESINILLYKGKNECQGTHLSSKIAQKLNFTEFMILFMLLGIPTVYLLFTLLIWVLNKTWKKKLKGKDNV